MCGTRPWGRMMSKTDWAGELTGVRGLAGVGGLSNIWGLAK